MVSAGLVSGVLVPAGDLAPVKVFGVSGSGVYLDRECLDWVSEALVSGVRQALASEVFRGLEIPGSVSAVSGFGVHLGWVFEGCSDFLVLAGHWALEPAVSMVSGVSMALEKALPEISAGAAVILGTAFDLPGPAGHLDWKLRSDLPYEEECCS